MRFGREGKAACPADRCGGSTASGADRSWTLNLGLRTVRGSGPAPGEGAEPQKEMGCLASFPEMPAARIRPVSFASNCHRLQIGWPPLKEGTYYLELVN